MSRPSVALGVDLGGTKIEGVVLDAGGHSGGMGTRGEPRELARHRVATERERGYEAILERTAEVVREVAKLASVDPREVPIGVGMPGAVTRTGLIKNSNTTCLNGRPFRTDLERTLGRPVVFDNDANCFALAEARLGAGAAHLDGVVFGAILGTGVGGGVVMFGRVWSGPQSIAGEWGHHAVWAGRGDARPCYCGQRGCLERYASGPAVEEAYAAGSGERRSLVDIVQRRATDPHAAAAIEELVDAFGRGVANLIDVLDPSVIVLGGGVSNIDALYTDGLERVRRYVFTDELMTPIVKNVRGDSAGVIGAALLGLQPAPG